MPILDIRLILTQMARSGIGENRDPFKNVKPRLHLITRFTGIFMSTIKILWIFVYKWKGIFKPVTLHIK